LPPGDVLTTFVVQYSKPIIPKASMNGPSTSWKTIKGKATISWEATGVEDVNDLKMI
jgi:hypothetical protein